MIRFTLRQFRLQSWVAASLLLITAVLFASTGAHLAHVFDVYAKSAGSCTASVGPCLNTAIKIGKLDHVLELVGSALAAVPGLLGAFWGAPLISREFEHGTHRLVWTQSVSRKRWLATKFAVLGPASMVVSGLLSLMVTWWSQPIDQSNMDQFSAGLFGERNITPLGYTAFAFVLGVTAGILIRRSLPAMATTLIVFLAARLAFTYLLRQHLIAPTRKTQPLAAVVHGFGQTNNSPPNLFARADLPNSWIYSTTIVNNQGHALSGQTLNAACPALRHAFGGAAALHDCIAKLAPTYHGLTTYQPASRYWILQSYETGIYLLAALALAAVCFYFIRHRIQ